MMAAQPKHVAWLCENEFLLHTVVYDCFCLLNTYFWQHERMVLAKIFCLLFLWVWSLVSHNEGRHGLRQIQSGVLKKTFAPKKWRQSGEDYITRSFMLCIPHQTLFGWPDQKHSDTRGMWHDWEMRCACGVLMGKLEAKRPSKNRVKWIDLVQGRGKWKAVVKAAISLWIP